MAAIEGQKVFGMTLRAAQAGKASVQAATGEERFNGAHHHGAERAATGFDKESA
jgi:hypothetical protein